MVAPIQVFNIFQPGGPIPRPDLLIVARGGGSIEDLWGFNEEAVVRAVVASAIPVISAVGHETDTTLIDYAADMRAPTPTAAAEAAVPVRSELIAYVDDLGHRTRNSVRRAFSNDRDRLRAAAAQLPRPLDLLAVARQRLDHASSNLLTALRHAGQRKTIDLGQVAPRLTPQILWQRARELAARLTETGRRNDGAAARAVERRRAAFAAVAARLSPNALRGDLRHSRNSLSPVVARLTPAFARLVEQRSERLTSLGKLLDSYSYKNVLDRGFALVTDGKGQIVRSRLQVHPGEPLSIEVADGQIGATVSGAPVVRRNPRPPQDAGPGHESLF